MNDLWRVMGGSVVALLAGCAGSAPAAESYVGLRHPPEPDGVEDEAGWLLEPRDGGEFAVAVMRDGEGRMLWLQRLVSRDAGGNPMFEVLGVERLPDTQRGEELAMVGCRIGTRGDMSTDLVAIVRSDPATETLTGARHAWRVDAAGRRFVPVSTKQVECLNEAAGL
ncbi:hypothetical protein [Longimicrobium terrae]|uniref:Lipoprotein n=1 Tax=Longimicrobium terrae TaxID=1639882 RepID=A0A841GM84_9BACT|nr:hypothetical protein [Longimicrobium terrae]MBB4634698.1 hypothetical protein [Longimicrobium terrae]MBB6068412.1 hypothetical protein [Longimicrobium terrae]NNC32692.1 hypothetical protein [Longimicrobium terrae]